MPRRVTGPAWAPPAPQPWEQPPAGWPGTRPEWALAWAALRLGYVLGETVFYQSPFAGGRMFAGGAVADFWFPQERVVVRLQGEYWHYGRGGDKRASDALQKMELEASGVTVIDIDAEDALRAPVTMLRQALAGEDRSRAGSRGG